MDRDLIFRKGIIKHLDVLGLQAGRILQGFETARRCRAEHDLWDWSRV
ncbi:MAG: hypothetical protein ISS63_15680 [Desulfobacteraceae bacterium]|nr:hypothetical protein [Desulfobacteraceae bacterium]